MTECEGIEGLFVWVFAASGRIETPTTTAAQ